MTKKMNLSRPFQACSQLNLITYYSCTDNSRKDGCLWNQILVLTGPEPAEAGHWQELLEAHTERTPSSPCSTAVVITVPPAVTVIASKITAEDRKQLSFQGSREAVNHEENEKDC